VSPSSAARRHRSVAKCEEAGGIDLIVIYNSGRYRMAGRGSLAGLMAYGNANQIVMEMACRSAASGQAHAGAGGRERHRSFMLTASISCGRWRTSGSRACRNFPTVGLFDGIIRNEPRGDRMATRSRST